MEQRTNALHARGKETTEYEIATRVLAAADELEKTGKVAAAAGASVAAAAGYIPHGLAIGGIVGGAGALFIGVAHLARLVVTVFYTSSRTKVKLQNGQPIAEEAAALREEVAALAKTTGEVKTQLEGVVSKAKAAAAKTPPRE